MSRFEKDRKAQIFSLDVLITLIPILLILGASAQYIFNTQEAFSENHQDIELTSISRTILNRLVTEAELSPDGFEDIDVITRAEELGGPDNYYYFVQLYTGAGIERANVGDEYWSMGLDEESPRFLRNATGSWKRFILSPNWDYRDGSGEPQRIANISEVSLAVWK